MSTIQQPDVSKSAPLHIEQLSTATADGCNEGASPDKEAEKRLLRKLDMRIVPILWLMFMLAFLDRTNVCCASLRGDSIKCPDLTVAYRLGMPGSKE
jgi:hypothetical protein